MPRIDFYVLPENANMERFACAMIGKAWSKGNQVYVHSASRTDAIRFDDLLWIFNDISFLPHALLEEDGQDEAPIVIGWQDAIPEDKQVMLNLSPGVPDFARDFARIIEIVAGDQAKRQQARERYRHYRDLDFELHDHTIDSVHEFT
jgi:DNA polymerase-3 subunit chi